MGSRLVLVGVLLGASLAGCVGARQKKDTEAADKAIAEHNEGAEPEAKIVCRRERVLGSNRSERVCRRKGDRRRDRDRAADAMRQQQPGPPGGEGLY